MSIGFRSWVATHRRARRRVAAPLIVAIVAIVAALGASAYRGALAGEGSAGVGSAGDATQLRLGVLANLTHAPALVGVQRNLFAEALGEQTELQVSYLGAGGQAVEALFAGSLDLAYLGPNPAINGYMRSGGEALRVIAGATAAGASLVVSEGIEEPEDLVGATLASPALGNTQDVALRTWLAEHDLHTDLSGGGDVSVRPLDNPEILSAFQLGEIDGAWVPEPWATRLVLDAGGHVLVDERDRWPEGRFATTVVVARTAFLEEHPEAVRRFLEGHLEALTVLSADPRAARAAAGDAIEAASRVRLSERVLTGAWANLEPTSDPLVATLAAMARDAQRLGLLEPGPPLADLHDTRILDQVRRARGEPEVTAP